MTRSTTQTLTPRRRRWPMWGVGLAAAAIVATLAYVAYARLQGLAGFPLDDAWIHQTYARNLAHTGQLAYLPGQPSAGSTSPAWSYLLSLAYLLGVDPIAWSTLLGGASLFAVAVLAYRLVLRLPGQPVRPGAPLRPLAALLAGLLCAVEWHLVWAAVSGMETILFTALAMALLDYYQGHVDALHGAGATAPASVRTEQAIIRGVGIGLLAGVLALTRPEGLVLDALLLAAMVGLPWPSTRGEARLRLAAAAVALLILAVLLAPYLAFNWRTSGWLLPNTFFAKAAEYQTALSLPARIWRVLSPTLVGAQVLLLPGLIYGVYTLIRRRKPEAAGSHGGQSRGPALLPLAWWLILIGLYAVRLPVDYQHGRYTMPSIPLLIVYGAYGTVLALRPHARGLWPRVLSRAVPAALVLLAVLFLARGAVAYRDDTAFIEGEMVAVAHWIEAKTAPADLIAVHDIGAIGYFTDRPLLDLAGLITPEVVPFIADADRLAGWMAARGTAYAVFFPDFSSAYARLAADPRLRQVYCTGYAWTRAAGRANLCVYQLSNE